MVNHQLQVERRTAKERWPETEVLLPNHEDQPFIISVRYASIVDRIIWHVWYFAFAVISYVVLWLLVNVRLRDSSILSSCESEVQELMHQVDLMVDARKQEWTKERQSLLAKLDIREQEAVIQKATLSQKNSEVFKFSLYSNSNFVDISVDIIVNA